LNETTTSPERRSRFRWIGHLVLILAIIAVMNWWRSEPLATGEAPPLSGDLVGNGSFDLKNLKGKPVLVHFWASWCPVCKLGDEAVDSIAEDFDVITIATQSGNSAEISKHLAREGLAFPAIADPYGELATRWGVPGVPASFILDRTGWIRFATVGHTTELGLRGRLWAAGRGEQRTCLQRHSEYNCEY
jgi:thiol-disulfide isomerase/thioredoxin